MSLTDVGVAVGVLVGVDVGVDVGVLVGVDVGVFIQEHSCNRQVSYQESNGIKESGLRRLVLWSLTEVGVAVGVLVGVLVGVDVGVFRQE